MFKVKTIATIALSAFAVTFLYQIFTKSLTSQGGEFKRAADESEARAKRVEEAFAKSRAATESLSTNSSVSGAKPNEISSFSFPQSSCGDKLTGGNDTWYPVFIDGGNLEDIRSKFCADAVATQRKDTGIDTVQLASFTSRDKANEFAQAVDGDVGEPTVAQAGLDDETNDQDALVADSSSTQTQEGHCPVSFEQVKAELSAVVSTNYFSYNEITQGDKIISQVAQVYKAPGCNSLKVQIAPGFKLAWRLHLNKKYQKLTEITQSNSKVPCSPSDNIVENYVCETQSAVEDIGAAADKLSLSQKHQEEIQAMESFFQ